MMTEERRKDPRNCRYVSLKNWLNHCGERLSSSLVLATDEGLLIDETGAGEEALFLAAIAPYEPLEQKEPDFLQEEIRQLRQKANVTIRPFHLDRDKLFLVCHAPHHLDETELRSICDGVCRIL